MEGSIREKEEAFAIISPSLYKVFKMTDSFYDFSAISLNGENVSMTDFQGKRVLVVNTASKCGLTSQYEGLEALYQKHKESLVVLGFPCNQFGEQEPGNEKSIQEGCVLNYGVTFPMFSKILVNGPETHAIYQFLKEALLGEEGKDIEWNFAKFLINEEGIPVKRFAPGITPEEVDSFLV